MSIKQLVQISLLAVVAVTGAAVADNDMKAAKTKLSDAELQVLAHYHGLNQMEIELGKAAQKHATVQAIKDFAKTMVTDHTSNDKDLTAFAKKHGATIPKEMPANESDQQAIKDAKTEMNRIEKLKGSDFDRAYVDMMVKGHDQELANIDAMVRQTSDPDLTSMINDIKPVLQRHADAAHDLQKNNAQAAR